MRLIIGGYAQGKLDYVLEKYKDPVLIWDGMKDEELPTGDGYMVLHNLHSWIGKKLADANFSPDRITEMILTWTREHTDCIVICNEIGSGVVPVDADERAWREVTGRICTALAKEAESVERIVCGLAQRLG